MPSTGTPMRTTRSTSSGATSTWPTSMKHIGEYRLKRDDIMSEVTDAAGESTKIPRLQQALQEFDENFDVIGLVNFNWGHAKVKSLSHDDRYIRRAAYPSEQEHDHQEQVCSSVSCRSRKDVQDVRHGTADHSATPELEIKGSGHAPVCSRSLCSRGRHWWA